MADKRILLGYEVGGKKPISVPLAHMLVVGQTQRSGKTTAMEALISRAPSEIRAIAFLTKRGEQAFQEAKVIPPYFRERADWQFVEAVLEATMRQKLKPHRSFIMKVTQGHDTLKAVHTEVRIRLEKARGFAESIYTELDKYLEIVLPQIGKIKFAKRVELAAGVNVMDLREYTTEMQALIIRSVLEWISLHEEGVITIIPEAWELVPQGRNTPVKLAFEDIIRKGGALRNFVWLDGQDTAGIEKFALRACRVWLLGVQREGNEIRRTIDSIPISKNLRPKPEEIATLKLGEFFVVWDEEVHKVYVQPVWLSDQAAKDIASGKVSVEEAYGGRLPTRKEEKPVNLFKRSDKKKEVAVGTSPNSVKDLENKRQEFFALQARLAELAKELGIPFVAISDSRLAPAVAVFNADRELLPLDGFDDLYFRIKTRLLQDDSQLLIAQNVPELEIRRTRTVIKADANSLRGRIALLIAGGFFDKGMNGYAVFIELSQRQQFKVAKVSVYNELAELNRLGFLTRDGEKVYRVQADMKINIEEE